MFTLADAYGLEAKHRADTARIKELVERLFKIADEPPVNDNHRAEKKIHSD